MNVAEASAALRAVQSDVDACWEALARACHPDAATSSRAITEFAACAFELQKRAKTLGLLVAGPTCPSMVEFVDDLGLVGFRACGLALTAEGECPIPGAHALTWRSPEPRTITLR